MYDSTFGIVFALFMLLCMLASFALATLKRYDPTITNRQLALRDLQLRQNEPIYMVNGAVAAVTGVCTVSWLFSSQAAGWNIVPAIIVGAIAAVIAALAYRPVNHPTSKYGITLAK